jgi:RNA polymerase sigma factor (sigma-70 family)
VAADPLADTAALVRRVYAYVAYRIGDGHDAEDVVNDVFERAVRYRASYDRRLGPPAAWLVGIARNVLNERGQGRIDLTAEPPERTAAGDLAEDSARRIALAGALGHLSDAERELVALRYGADLTAREIGAVVGSRTNAVEVALHRALGKLRPLLWEDFRSGAGTRPGDPVRPRARTTDDPAA